MERWQIPRGYRLIGWFNRGDAADRQAAGVVGYRRGFSWAWGHYVYVDDLSVLPTQRRRGLGTLLMQAVLAAARSERVDSIHLDSGLGPERTSAHRLYESLGFTQTSAHFRLVPTEDR